MKFQRASKGENASQWSEANEERLKSMLGRWKSLPFIEVDEAIEGEERRYSIGTGR